MRLLAVFASIEGLVFVEESLPFNGARERCRTLGLRLSTLANASALPSDWSSAWTASVRRSSSDDASAEWLYLYSGEKVFSSSGDERRNESSSSLLPVCEGTSLTIDDENAAYCLERRRENCLAVRPCREAAHFACDDEEEPPVFTEDYPEEQLRCRNSGFCFVISKREDCWSACSRGGDINFFEPLGASGTRTQRSFFGFMTNTCCCGDPKRCCKESFASVSPEPFPGEERPQFSVLDDGVLGLCEALPTSSQTNSSGNRLRAVAIVIILMTLFCVTILIIIIRRARYLSYEPALALNTLPSSGHAVEARHALTSVVADEVLDIPVAKVIDDLPAEDFKEDDRGDIELQNLGEHNNNRPSTTLPTATPAADDAVPIIILPDLDD